MRGVWGLKRSLKLVAERQKEGKETEIRRFQISQNGKLKSAILTEKMVVLNTAAR